MLPSGVVTVAVNVTGFPAIDGEPEDLSEVAVGMAVLR
jgi:hypothetical protein